MKKLIKISGTELGMFLKDSCWKNKIIDVVDMEEGELGIYHLVGGIKVETSDKIDSSETYYLEDVLITSETDPEYFSSLHSLYKSWKRKMQRLEKKNAVVSYEIKVKMVDGEISPRVLDYLDALLSEEVVISITKITKK